MAEAENAGLTYSEYIAVVLAERHHFELPPEHFEPKGRRARQDAPDGTVQEEIAMQIAV